ncbi:MAG: SigE family polymerase sigma factor, partial [Frankiales bacterium]|nr:SigE family polymerase sigma factor [Frankiales bacterium]
DVEAFLAGESPALLRAAVVLTGNPSDAQDLAQVVCLQVWRKWGRVSSARDPRAYAHRILINAHLTERRRRHHSQESPRAWVPDQEATDSFAGSDALESLRVLVASLPEKQRMAVVLRFVCDFDDARTAEILDCSVATVRSQISRALGSLRKQTLDKE